MPSDKIILPITNTCVAHDLPIHISVVTLANSQVYTPVLGNFLFHSASNLCPSC